MIGSEWAAVLKWALWGVAMAAVMGWVARGRARPTTGARAGQLAQPTSILVIGAASALFFGAIAVVSNAWSNDTTTWWTTAIFVGFAALGLWTIASYHFERHDVTDAGMHHRSLIRGERRLAWSDVMRIRYSDTMKWFRLDLRAGAPIRVSATCTNLPTFARLLRLHARRAEIDGDTARILEHTEEGRPPPIWG